MNKLRFAGLGLAVLFFLASCAKKQESRVEEKFPDGKKKTERMFRMTADGEQLVGEAEYYPDGMKKYEGGYHDGRRNGRWTYWHPNGNLWSDGFFRDDVPIGHRTIYYENGKKYYEGDYLNGARVGKWKFYDRTGKLVKEVEFNEAPQK